MNSIQALSITLLVIIGTLIGMILLGRTWNKEANAVCKPRGEDYYLTNLRSPLSTVNIPLCTNGDGNYYKP